MTISNPSTSIDEVDIPEVSDLKTEFSYFFYTKDERINPDALLGNKVARSISLSWRPPRPNLSGVNSSIENQGIDLYQNRDKIVSEDNFFNSGYTNHTYSNISAITQGASDIENFSRLSNFDTESMINMANFQVQKVADKIITGRFGTGIDESSDWLGSISEAYTTLSNFPANTLGLRVIDNNGGVSDKDDLIRSIANSLTLTMKINNSVVPDVFRLASIDPNRPSLQTIATNLQQGQQLNSSNPSVPAVRVLEGANNVYGTVKIIGYVIDKYIYINNKFIKQDTVYISGANNSSYLDTVVMYGKTYFYAIRTVASLMMLLYNDRSINSIPTLAEVWVSSKPVTTAIETFEDVPPPPPSSLGFSFDYRKRNLCINWEVPTDRQNDIKQYQVFRRSSTKHPFELIAQYGFDDSDVEEQGNSKRYLTFEEVDANNYYNMKSDLRYLVKLTEGPVYSHIDEDFTVDSEFYESSDYIYAVCSVDAHGMISNYSTQYRVTFDSYKNSLDVSVIANSGCPKQYPNLKLINRVFKDVIGVQGDNTKQLSVHFTPEYLRLKESDRRARTIPVVATQKGVDDKDKSYYLLQFLNSDNQKVDTIKINIQDPRRRVP